MAFFGVPSLSLLKPTPAMQANIDNTTADDYKKGTNGAYRFEKEVDNLKENFTIIEHRKLDFSKPILVIYNPVSGKKVDLRGKIRAAVKEAGGQVEIYETTGFMDAFEKARKCDID